MAVKIYIALIAVALVLATVFYITEPHDTPTIMTQLAKTSVTVGSTTIEAEVASTPASRGKGLSDRASLLPGNGMLFVFEEEGSWGIWMKDMQFPIDIIWAGSNGSIITIEKNITPSTYPTAFYPETPRAKYVLEVPAGFADEHTLAEGDIIVVQ
ncbi:DUF192 domain-containing protein [Acetobacteraceae bacterium]|nr:DUF192 domain-containing protein [Candidatus Parcubacteria bacterium]